MQKNMDKIQFESRCEIDEIVDALDTYQKEHPKSRSKETVQKMLDLLNMMYMEW